MTKSILIGVALAALLNATASSQDITVDQLDAAQAFAPGIQIEDALSSNAWSGTPASRASRLLETMPTETDNPIIRAMLRRVVLSGLARPEGAGETFETTRIVAAQTLATPDEYARFAARNPAARDPILRANAFIATGDLASACGISDIVQDGRAESVWVRIRAACHDLREETSAAELARGILRDRGEPTELVIPETQEGFWVDVMGLDAAALDIRMTELAGQPEPVEVAPADGLSEPDQAERPIEEQLGDYLEDFIDPATRSESLSATEDAGLPFRLTADPVPPPTFDLDAAMIDPSDEGTARLFILGRDGNSQAVAEFVKRAQTAGLEPARVLRRIPALLDPVEMAEADLALFARYAVVTQDIPMIQALFVATQDEQTKSRLALASDAMGGGFDDRSLGVDLATAMIDRMPGSQIDVLIALALGSRLSDRIEEELFEAAPTGELSANSLALDHAVERRAQAETLLRVAEALEADTENVGFKLYRAIRALRSVGFEDMAGQLAAYAYLRDL